MPINHTRVTIVEEFETHDDMPMAQETHVNNPEEIPFAQQIFDTKKLYRRWAKCCEISLRIAHIGLEHANNLETQATIGATFGMLFGSQQMQEDASETSRRAHETRKTTLIASVMFLAASIVLTSLYWAVEEGLIGTIVKSIAACVSSCVNAVSSACSWINKKATSMFKRSDMVEQNNNLHKSFDLEEEDGVVNGIEVHQDQDMSMFKQAMFMPSGGHTSYAMSGSLSLIRANNSTATMLKKEDSEEAITRSQRTPSLN